MTSAARSNFGRHVPDILDCLAQLSNDEVPTPPKLARSMLDILPDDVWGDPDLRWLDPFCKSGVFLREIAGRLLGGLSDWEPDFRKRRAHIFRNMIFGTSITEMTGYVSRRSLYYSRDASSDVSVVQFDTEDGNVPFVPAKHTFPRGTDGKLTGSCTICGAPVDLERGGSRENYAYAFIHGAYPTKETSAMKFDVIVGNPPYQLDTGGSGAQARPVYHRFVEEAIDLDPRYVLMITPSRWFAGGWGLGPFRKKMLADHRIRELVDYPKLYDAFPGVKIRGGVYAAGRDPRVSDDQHPLSTHLRQTVADLVDGSDAELERRSAPGEHRLMQVFGHGCSSARDPSAAQTSFVNRLGVLRQMSPPLTPTESRSRGQRWHRARSRPAGSPLDATANDVTPLCSAQGR